MDMFLPYGLYHTACDKENKISHGTTTHVEAIDGEYGSFCQHDKITFYDESENLSDHTVFQKLQVTSCGEMNSDNIVEITTYSCSNPDCSSCKIEPSPQKTNDAIAAATRMQLGSTGFHGYVNASAFDPIPTKENCFAVCLFPDANMYIYDNNIEAATIPEVICSYKKFDAGVSSATTDRYWRVLRENSCLRDRYDEQISNATGTEIEDVDSLESDGERHTVQNRPFAMSLTFTDPLPYALYGEGDGCHDSNEIYTGSTSAIHMFEPGMFCQEDFLDDATAVYTKLEILSCPETAGVHEEFVVVEHSSCTDLSCSNCSVDSLYTSYISELQADHWLDTHRCFDFSFLSEIQTPDYQKPKYQQYHETTKAFHVIGYLQFIREHSCLSELPLSPTGILGAEDAEIEEEEHPKYVWFPEKNEPYTSSGYHSNFSDLVCTILVSGYILFAFLTI